METDKEAAKRANIRMFEVGLKTAYFSAITDQLVEKGLITKKEEKMIRKKIDEMRAETLFPTPEVSLIHARKTTHTEALPDDTVRAMQRQRYLEKQKKKQKTKC